VDYVDLSEALHQVNISRFHLHIKATYL
jgi:hypothetical protein